MKPYLFIALALLTACSKSENEKHAPLPALKVSTMDITFMGQRYELRDTLGDTNIRFTFNLYPLERASLYINTAEVRFPSHYFAKLDSGRLGTYETSYVPPMYVKDSLYFSTFNQNSLTVTSEDEEKYEGHLSFLLKVDTVSRGPFEGVFKIYKLPPP